jgi:DNA-directed RNA polymerase specialized sigma24 family protein
MMNVTTTLNRQIGNQPAPVKQMNEDNRSQDLELRQLAIEIQASSSRKDRVVRKQIDRLLAMIQIRLESSQRALIRKWSGIVDIEEIVNEAIGNTLMEASKNIDRYDPQYSVMQWVNGILQYRFKDLLRKYRERYESISFDNPDAMVEAKIAQISEPTSDLLDCELSQFIKADPEGHLAQTHIRNHPDATLQNILLMRLDGLKWQEIAIRLNINSHSTINTFFDRQLHKFNNYFRKYLCQ